MYACCAGKFAYLDSIIRKAIRLTSKYGNIHSFVYSLYIVNGTSKEIYDTMTQLKDIDEYNKPRILVRLLMDDIRNRTRYVEFKRGLTHLLESLYHQIEFVG